jgi:fatty-acyl-CoA synthase
MPLSALPASLPDAPGTEPPSRAWLRALELTAGIDANPSRTLPVVIDEMAQRCGAAPALLSEAERFTFADLAERAHRYARWALVQGVKPGDVVCLLMPNRPEYMAVWLGITSVGGVTALLNTNLKGASLAHCIATAGPQHLIADAVFADALSEALPHLQTQPHLWMHGENPTRHVRIDLALDAHSPDPLTDAERPPVSLSDRALLIYTSGTTGLPKAAHVSHHRLTMWSHWFAGMMGAVPEDRLYNCLPMYHSVGGVVATGAALVAGASVVLREGFSASAFWDEVVRWDCTLFQYIGELCRYLLKAPKTAAETQHRLRLCCGNGLRKDVWLEFEARFHIPRILEFYAATEGNFSLFNAEARAGAIGRIPSFLAHRFPAVLIKLDPDTGQPLRDANGFCVKCGPDEDGEAIGKVGAHAGSRFEGYTNPAETEKKLLRDVFAPGDAWVRTGDLMRKDAAGFFYFVDRTGDTFRWKGENVATTEVAEVIAGCPGVEAVSVYGVEVPGAEGRAGMAAIVAGEGFDLTALRHRLSERLPDYARPLFVRMVADLSLTETFKQKKHDLVRDGFDPARAGGVFFDDRAAGGYVPVDAGLFELVNSGGVRL